MAVDNQGNPRAVPKPEGKKRGGKSPRQQGARVERMVAKHTGGTKTIGSGAFKNTNHNLEGDVEVPDADGKPLVKLEVKACGVISAKGEKSYALSKNMLDQMVKEAEAVNEIGAAWIHYKGQSIEEGYIIMQAKHWTRFLELAKLGATLEK
jgi:hypothetical protein